MLADFLPITSSVASSNGDVFSVPLVAGLFGAYILASYANAKLSVKVSTALTVLAIVTAMIGLDSIWVLPAAVSLGVGGVAGTVLFYVITISSLRHNAKIKAQLAAATQSDPVWNEQALTKLVKSLFITYETDWANRNLGHIRSYTTDRYYVHVQLLFTALQQLDRHNDIRQPQLEDVELMDINDDADDSKDSFTAHVIGRATSVLLAESTKRVLYQETKKPIEEYWRFVRRGNDWLLDGIQRETADEYNAVQSLRTFAEQNQLYYSLDMGSLLVPERGILFGSASFADSSIDNHIIGTWHGLLVQLYSYVQDPNAKIYRAYLVGQVNLPKSYGGIIIRRKDQYEALDQLFSNVPKRYQAVRMEWPDFNRRYEVYAADADKATSFELLNPTYMAKLYDLNLPISIEVVDNSVYFFAPVPLNGVVEGDYKAMLDVLQGAFKELKM